MFDANVEGLLQVFRYIIDNFEFIILIILP